MQRPGQLQLILCSLIMFCIWRAGCQNCFESLSTHTAISTCWSSNSDQQQWSTSKYNTQISSAVQTSTILHSRRFRDGGAAAGYLYGSDLDETDCSLTSQQVENNGNDWWNLHLTRQKIEVQFEMGDSQWQQSTLDKFHKPLLLGKRTLWPTSEWSVKEEERWVVN